MHVQVLHAESDLHGIFEVVRPALLYADRVTIHSPAAWLLRSIADLGAVTDPYERFLVTAHLARSVPTLGGNLTVNEETIAGIKGLFELGPELSEQLGAIFGARHQVEQVNAAFDEMREGWERELPKALAEVERIVGGRDLLVAMETGAIEVADLTEARAPEVLADTINTAAAGGSGSTGQAEEVVAAFVARIVELLTDPASFPLLDAQAAGLARAMEREAGLVAAPRAVRRSGEVSAAAAFMGFLPAFPDLPVDEVLDLRAELRAPLVRFRAAMAALSADFAARSVDEDFAVEVEDAWRKTVEPALADIREALAEHKLLRHVASIALGDPKRLAAEAGGVIAATHADLLSLSGLMAVGAVVGVPLVDVVGRAMGAQRRGRSPVRSNGFYFLHHLGEHSQRRVA